MSSSRRYTDVYIIFLDLLLRHSWNQMVFQSVPQDNILTLKCKIHGDPNRQWGLEQIPKLNTQGGQNKRGLEFEKRI